MRTTVDIDQNLLQRLRDRAHQSGRSFREELNQAIHRGLTPESSAPAPRYQTPTFDLGPARAGLDLDKALALSATLDDEEIRRRLEPQG